MIPQEQADKIEKIYTKATSTLRELAEKRNDLIKKREDVIHDYIKELEVKKVSTIRQNLGLTDK